MKILLIPEVSVSGGTGTFIRQLLEIHKKYGINTEVLLPKSLTESSIPAYILKNGASLHLIKDRRPFQWIGYLSLVFEFFNYRKYIKQFKPDIIVCSTGTLGHNLFSFFCNYPLVYILHSYPKKVSLWEKPLFWIPRILSNNSKIIYTVSQFSKKMIEEHWSVDKEYIKVIYNNSSAVIGKKKKSVYRTILTLGHVVHYKNPFLWIEIAKKVTAKYEDVEFIWLGEGELLEECRMKILGHQRIKFMGFDPEPAKYYKSAHLYLHPSKIESLGLSAIDALAYGIPCIISNAGGLPETVEDGLSGFVCELQDISSYYNKIELLLNDDKLYDEMARNAYFSAKERFSIDKQMRQIYSLYNSTISSR